MSFFKNLFSRDNEQPAPQAQPAPAPEPEPEEELPELFTGMSLDVVTTEGRLLLTGLLTGYSNGCITVERQPGFLAFDTCDVGAKVYVRGFNRMLTSFNLSGSILESSRIICRVGRLSNEYVPNQRLNFRLPVNTPASMFRPEDEHFQRPEPCELIDVSIGGACVETEYIHAENEVVQLRFKLQDYPTMTFLGQIVRGIEFSSGRYRYGVLFAKLREDEQTALTRTIYNIQIGNRREWNRRKDGSWA